MMMKKLILRYEKIDVCENDCMLYYGDDTNKIVCDIYGNSRYKGKRIKVETKHQISLEIFPAYSCRLIK